jgi:threonine synthase
MRFTSTRGGGEPASLSEALSRGLAPDGGLYLPQQWPAIGDASAFPSHEDLPGVAQRLLAPFASGDRLESEMGSIARESFDFPAPLIELDAAQRLSVLELFHGPTAAFKDFGARFLAACLTRLRAGAARTLEILVATSGDTGGAVAAAFHRRPGIGVAVLFPRGLVSPTQERQLTCWGENVRSFSVHGTFDDCQRLVKEAFLDPELRAHFELSSANSINLGRLLPQMVYYAASSLAVLRRHGMPASYVIPSGNLGNASACVMARRVGFPIADIVLAHNANRTVPDYFETGEWRPRASVATLASAMDVGNPSNMERLRSLYPTLGSIREALSVYSVSDEAIRERIRGDYARYGRIWCPHTAIAAEAHARLPRERREGRHWVLVSTAHPAKFREIVEPLIGGPVAVPEALAKLFDRPVKYAHLDARLDALRSALGQGQSH